MKFDAALANTAWLATSLVERARFLRSATEVEATQRGLLKSYLRNNAATEFGRAHDFANIDCWEAYAERVPARRYEDIAAWIERIAMGEPNVLTAEAVSLLEPTSGSSGAEKWIPYTQTLRREYRRGVAAWVAELFLRDPSLIGGRAYWSLTPQIERKARVTTAIPIGFDADSAYLGGFAQRLIGRTQAAPPQLKSIPAMSRFWHLTLLALLKCRDLRLISVWHPSYILLLLRHLRETWDELLVDLRDGVVQENPIVRLSPAPERAAELEDIGPGLPIELWPKLRLISCWADAQAAQSLSQLRAEFPGVRLQPKGLIATEAFVSLPWGTQRPLSVRSHFFEFRDDRGMILPAWRLRPGDSYAVIVTTGGGLYRYELGDRVQVTGHTRDIPNLRFLGKEDNVSDHFGEKLSEEFVSNCMATVFARHELEPGFAMLALDDSDPAPGYTLFIESAKHVPDRLIERLEEELCRNPHYALCIRLGQLRPLRIVRLAADAYAVYSQALMERGMRLGDIKPTPLSRHRGWAQRFAGQRATPR